MLWVLLLSSSAGLYIKVFVIVFTLSNKTKHLGAAQVRWIKPGWPTINAKIAIAIALLSEW